MSDDKREKENGNESSGNREQRDDRGRGSRGGGGRGGRDRRGGGGRFRRRVKVCDFCVNDVKFIDYKEHDMLRRYVQDSGKIRPRRQTGTCARHQRALARAIKRARHVALLPYTFAHNAD